MHRELIRAFSAVTVAVITLTSAAWISDPAPAQASDESSRFVLTVFPHNTNEIGFSNSWGAPRSGGRRHEGIDIMSPRRTEVLAVADGVVTKLGKHPLSGYFIRIDHGDGWSTTYMHLNNDTCCSDDGKGGTWTAYFATLMEGDEVEAGQVIGYVGDSGNAEGTVTHTHFEIKHDGRKTNPYPFLREAYDREHRLPPELGQPL